MKILGELNAGNLRERICLIRRLKRACQKIFLFHRLRAFAWINAGTTQEEELSRAHVQRLGDNIVLYLEILKKEVCGPSSVCLYSADPRRKMEDEVGRGFGKEPPNVFTLPQ